jgi:hypothetical protein
MRHNLAKLKRVTVIFGFSFFIRKDKFCMAKIDKEQLPEAEDLPEKKVRLLRKPGVAEVAPRHRQMIEGALEATQGQRWLQ